MVDLSTLPTRQAPLHYNDFSIVDGPGFSDKPSPDRVTATDPRDASAQKGRQVFEQTVKRCVELAKEALRQRRI